MDNVSNIDVEDVIVSTEDVTIAQNDTKLLIFVYGTIETRLCTGQQKIFMQQIEDVSQLTEVFWLNLSDIETVSDTKHRMKVLNVSTLQSQVETQKRM